MKTSFAWSVALARIGLMLKLAERILQSKSTDFDTSRFVDRYEEAVVEMLSKKQAGLPVSRERALARPQDAVNLMEALRRQHCTGKRIHSPAEAAQTH
jgi:DNA end-binding protein Ku